MPTNQQDDKAQFPPPLWPKDILIFRSKILQFPIQVSNWPECGLYEEQKKEKEKLKEKFFIWQHNQPLVPGKGNLVAQRCCLTGCFLSPQPPGPTPAVTELHTMWEREDWSLPCVPLIFFLKSLYQGVNRTQYKVILCRHFGEFVQCRVWTPQLM
jgi:hypothetical protein